MSLSIFQSFFSTASLQSELSLPQPTPFSIVPSVHTFGRRHQNLGDTRPADDRRNGAARTQSIKVTVSSQDDGVEVSTVETQMMQTTVLSTTTVAAVPDDPSPNPPPAAETTPLPPAAPTPISEPIQTPEPNPPAPANNAQLQWSAFFGALGVPARPATEATATKQILGPIATLDFKDIQKGNGAKGGQGHHRRLANDDAPTFITGPSSIPTFTRGPNAKPHVGAFDAALNVHAQPPAEPTSTTIVDPKKITDLNHGHHRRMARDILPASHSVTSSSLSPVYTSGPPPLKRDPTITITDSETRPTPVSLGLRRDENEGHGLEERRNGKGKEFSTHTVVATDPQPTPVKLDGMGSDVVNSIPVEEYAFDRLDPGSRVNHGYRKRMEKRMGVTGQIPDAEASGGMRVVGSVVFALLVWVGVGLVLV